MAGKHVRENDDFLQIKPWKKMGHPVLHPVFGQIHRASVPSLGLLSHFTTVSA
jgi:hypothetical protein